MLTLRQRACHNRYVSAMYGRQLHDTVTSSTVSRVVLQSQISRAVPSRNVSLQNKKKNPGLGSAYLRAAFGYKWAKTDETQWTWERLSTTHVVIR